MGSCLSNELIVTYFLPSFDSPMASPLKGCKLAMGSVSNTWGEQHCTEGPEPPLEGSQQLFVIDPGKGNRFLNVLDFPVLFAVL